MTCLTVDQQFPAVLLLLYTELFCLSLDLCSYDKDSKTGGSNGATMRYKEGEYGANAGLKVLAFMFSSRD
jgi:hypothetical protein